MLINQNVSARSFLDAEISVSVLLNYWEGFKVPTSTWFLIDQFSQHIQYHMLSIQNTSMTIDSFVVSNTKPK